MHIAIQKIINIKSKFSLEQIYNGVILLIVAVIMLLSVFALLRPIGSVQFENIKKLSMQQVHTQTQEMATVLMEQEHISYDEYLKLMQAHQTELHQAKQLPAMALENQ
ncbi:hypothetical protein CDG60_09930 [Acinetobacter chinensis]|uniref:Uncharacterized protein n=1 Tax=Acinetobacter chinensis TaxID=2004650 RepID=A0A3B7LVN4_9GAMM|nr:hypothetical protein [Acinetobacter chinensis]AXY56846.1 hypothetical protein CDG60_09930 [Acinetobacter chinensis]